MALIQSVRKDGKRETQLMPLYDLPEEYLRLEYPQEWNYLRKTKTFTDRMLLM